jgi:DNA-binding PucR family transcriptional regulator
MLPAVTRTGTDAGQPLAPGPPSMISAGTLRRLELAAGGLAAACLTAMEQRLPWFARLPADQRAGVRLVTQTGVANFVAWLGERGETIRLTAEAFRIAPHDLARRLSLRQTVDLVRIATDVFERHLPPLATDEAERRALVEGVLRFGREIAFAAATVYAGAAETRGAWDARLEALVVDAVVRGPHIEGGADDALVSRAAALGWDPAAAVRVVAGSPAPDAPAERLAQLRVDAGRAGRSVLVGVQGSRLIVLLSESTGRHPATEELTEIVHAFGPGPVVLGPPAADLATAHASARDALAGLRAARGWPAAPRPVAADDLLPERALAGDALAHRRLIEAAIEPLDAAGGELLNTLACYLDGGGVLESCARTLFVHPNTVRYRLRRVAELTGRSPNDPRDALVLRFALIAARLGSGSG